MIKKILIIGGILFGLLIISGAVGVYYFLPDENKVLEFIEEHPAQTALHLVYNDEVLASQNANKMMPLASTVKTVIAIEYAHQAASGQLDPDRKVSLAELDRYYVPMTDGGAHQAWLTNSKKEIQNDSIPLRLVAKGMIQFSSNANTEWLLEKLGIEHVNQRLDSLGVKQHTPLYYFVSALFVGKELFPEQEGDDLVKALRALSDSEYRSATEKIHQKLKQDTTYKKEFGDLSMAVQKVWSDRLPASTVKEYASMMQKLNSRAYFSKEVQLYLNEVMETIMENPANQNWLKHSGMKGGSTPFVLTKALYATDLEGNRLEMVYFLNELNLMQMSSLQLSMNQFELNCIQSDDFREVVAKRISK